MSESITIPEALSDTSYAFTGRIYDNIQATIPGVQLPVIEMELWNVIQEFCRLSSYFRFQAYWTMQVGQALLDFNPHSADMMVYQVLNVTGLPYFQILPPAVLINTGDTTVVQQGWAWLALKPTPFGGVPPILFDLWFEAMLHGTLGRIFAHPAKPYSSPGEAIKRMQLFRAEVRRAKDQAERFNSNRQPPWAFPYFASGRRKN